MTKTSIFCMVLGILFAFAALGNMEDESVSAALWATGAGFGLLGFILFLRAAQVEMKTLKETVKESATVSVKGSSAPAPRPVFRRGDAVRFMWAGRLAEGIVRDVRPSGKLILGACQFVSLVAAKRFGIFPYRRRIVSNDFPAPARAVRREGLVASAAR